MPALPLLFSQYRACEIPASGVPSFLILIRRSWSWARSFMASCEFPPSWATALAKRWAPSMGRFVDLPKMFSDMAVAMDWSVICLSLT
jgi:hypothetical protein